ncbi:hypothetical protein IU485_27595 [Nocardia cyriacigeorgica]|uniref:hypothetical protein n=1 Tax=Nocardia cyriacigeorgica TaxID=135487 RepID=UPI0018948469|nr:hypothetical protein [Nocardia cyriacigeorgica]MBF6085141.1 hypothetical protein [Nocardia cyriacigeorgica]
MSNPEAAVLAAIDTLDAEAVEPTPDPFPLCRCRQQWHGLPTEDCPGAEIPGPPYQPSFKEGLARIFRDIDVAWLGATDPHDCPRSFMPVAAHTMYEGIPLCVHVGERGMCAYVQVPEVLASVPVSETGVLGITWEADGMWGIDTAHAYDYWPKELLHLFGVDRWDEVFQQLLGSESTHFQYILDKFTSGEIEPWTLEAMLGRAIVLAEQVAAAAAHATEGNE